MLNDKNRTEYLEDGQDLMVYNCQHFPVPVPASQYITPTPTSVI